MTPTEPISVSGGSSRANRAAAVLRVTSGNFIEQFDFSVRLLRDIDLEDFLPVDQRLRVVDAHLRGIWRGLSDASAGRNFSRRIHRQGGAAHRTDRHAVDHGERHHPDRVRARVCDDRAARARTCAAGTPVTGFSAGAELGAYPSIWPKWQRPATRASTRVGSRPVSKSRS